MTAWTITDSLIKKYTTELLEGRVLAVDPASGSSSMPGWAYYTGGILMESGVIQVKPHLPLNRRLFLIAQVLAKELPKPDVFVIEDIRRIRGVFGGSSVDVLMKSIGAIMSAVDCERFLEISPLVWKKYVTAEYEKSDENDAIWIGKVAIAFAQTYRNKLTNKDAEMLIPRKEPSNRKADLWKKPKTPKPQKPRPSKSKASSNASQASKSRAKSRKKRSR